MHSVRGVIYLANGSGQDWQDCYHRVVDIQGDSEIDFIVPYCPKIVTRSITESTNFGVWFKVLSWSQPNPTPSLPIYLNTYKAAANDFQFGVLLDKQFDVQCNPRNDFNNDFPPMHPSMTGYSPEKLVFGEKYTTMREMVHRYTPYGQVGASQRYGTTITPYDLPVSGKALLGIEMWGLCFMFYRGSIRFKFMLNSSGENNNNKGSMYMTVDSNPIQGSAIAMSPSGQIDCEVPYYYNQLMIQTNLAPNHPLYLMNDLSPRFMSKAAGDDFSFHWLRSYPQSFLTGSLVTTNVAFGTKGMMEFLYS